MNTSHWDLGDGEFLDQFQNCNLDPNIFTHEAHLRLAWIHINNDGLEIAVLKIKEDIKNYVRSLGKLDKYNDTLTEAATRAVYHFILKSESDTFPDFISEFPRLKNDFKQLMQSHYSTDIYNSNEAKTNFIEPDLQSFD